MREFNGNEMEEDNEGIERFSGIPNFNELLEGIVEHRRKNADLSFLYGNDDEADESNEDENDYHNRSAELAKLGKYSEAVETCIRGLEKFPLNMDLLANIVKYSSDIGDMETAELYFDILSNRIPRKVWNWRAYTFTLDYLMKDALGNEEKCREYIADYKKHLPYEEKASVAESELEEKLGNHERSKEILEERVNERFNAPQCALKLLDMQFSRGEFEEALKTCNYFAIANCEAQPSTNQHYQAYIRCLVEEALLHKKHYNGESVSEREVSRIKDLYDSIMKNPEIAMTFGSNIKDHISQLDFINVATD